MKILSIVGNKNLETVIKHTLPQEEYILVFDDNPIKALDILPVQKPDAVLFNFEDFPFHWKTFHLFTKNLLGNNCRFILMTGKSFLAADSAEAAFLEILPLSWNVEATVFAEWLKKILSAKPETAEKKKTQENSIDLIFRNPETQELILSTNISQLSDNDIIFTVPQKKISSLKLDDKVKCCTIKLGSYLIKPECCIASAENPVHFIFTSISESDKEAIRQQFTYL